MAANFYSNINGAFFVTTSGTVGIGAYTATDTLGANLNIKSNSAQIQLESTNGSGATYIISSVSNGSFAITKSGVGDRLLIDSSGNSTFAGRVTIDPDTKLGGVSGYNAVSLNGTLDINDYNLLSRSSDKNLYINRPTGNDIYFRENNADQVIIKSGGNVGIGETSPKAKLNITGVSGGPAVPISTSSAGIIRIESGNGGQALDIGAQGASPYSMWLQVGNASNSTGDTYPILLNPLGGNVGIGTTSPNNKLDVNGDVFINSNYTATNVAAQDLTIGKTSTGDHGLTIVTGPTYTGSIYFGDSGNNDAGIIKYQHSSNSMQFVTNRSEKMRIDSIGNVGIGTTSPDYKLDIEGADLIRAYNPSGSASIQIKASANSNSSVDFADPDDTNVGQIIYRHADNSMSFDTNDIEKMRITSTGNVGIGTTSPSSLLTLNKATGEVGILLEGNGTDVAKFKLSSAGVNHAVQIGSVSNNEVQFHTANSEKMRLAANGNVGIGTTSPAHKLSIEGGANTVIQMSHGSTAVYNWALAVQYITTNAFQIVPSTVVGGSVFTTPVATFKSTGNVGIGTVSPDYQLESRKSITYSDNIVDGDAQFSVASSASQRMTFGYDNVGNGFGYIKTGNQGLAYTPLYLNPALSGAGGGVSIGYAPNAATPPSAGLLVYGNVGIGTATPNRPLAIQSNSGATAISIYARAANDYGFIQFFANNQTTLWSEIAGRPSNLSFYQNSAEVLRLGVASSYFTSGNIGIGDTVPTSLSANTSSLTVNSTRTDLSGALFQKSNGVVKFQQYWTTVGMVADISAGDYFWKLANVNKMGLDTGTGALTVVGDVVAYGSPSDARLKENIKPIKSALDKAMKLQGVTFNWKKSDSLLDIKQDIGFIAQDVQKVLPELVRENEDGMLSMRHQGIAPILLEAIKELKTEMESLKLEIKTLKNK